MYEYDQQHNCSPLSDMATLQILSRLPVKSLSRFRCVCSSWLSLLNDPCLVSMHLNNHTRCPTRAFSHILFNYPLDLFSFNFIRFDNDSDRDSGNRNRLRLRPRLHEDEDEDENEDEVTMPTSLWSVDLSPFLDLEDFGLPLVAGCRDGLICLNGHVDKIALWNPTIGDFKILSASGLARPPLLPPARIQAHCVGFGFDPKAGDFKVIQILVFTSPSYTQVEVYSLSTDSWTELDVSVPPGLFAIPRTVSCADHSLNNGVIYWWDFMEIISFHLSDQIFHTMPLPAGAPTCKGSVMDFDGRFALMLWSSAEHWHINVWATNEFDTEASWTRLFHIGPLDEYSVRPYGFWGKHGSELFWHTGRGQIMIYNGATGETKPTGIQLGDIASDEGISIYKESLLPVTNKSLP